MRNYKIIGLTGPTGSGKTAASKTFKELGYSIIEADQLSRLSLKRGSITLKMLQTAFGDDIVDDSGEPDRRLIAVRAFSDKKSTELLMEITHPAIYMLALREIKRLTDSGVRKIIFDAPTLFDNNGQFICDFVVSVLARPDIRLKRIMLRDGLNVQQAQQRIEIQHEDNFFIERSDAALYNNGDEKMLRDEIYRLFGSDDSFADKI